MVRYYFKAGACRWEKRFFGKEIWSFEQTRVSLLATLAGGLHLSLPKNFMEITEAEGQSTVGAGIWHRDVGKSLEEVFSRTIFSFLEPSALKQSNGKAACGEVSLQQRGFWASD